MESSTAHAFFMAHKDLFEYDKYVGDQNFFQADTIHDQGNRSSFLDRYRELDQNASPVAEMPFSLGHSSRAKYVLAKHATAITSPPAPKYVTLQSTAAITTKFHSPAQVQNYRSATSPQRAIQHPHHQHIQSASSTYNTMLPLQQSGAQRASTTLADGYKPPSSLSSPQQHYSPSQRHHVSQSHSLQLHHSPVKSPLGPPSKRGVFCMPKLTELLIDRETRATVIPHKFLDEAHKIEVLIGGKCIGRVSAVSRNIPPSIRMRLQASAIVSRRRERLYDLLRRDYEDLNKRYT